MIRQPLPEEIEVPDGYEVMWTPNSEVQRAALQASEFEVFYGGAKGGGKSDWLVAGAMRQVEFPEYKALLLRHTFPELAELIRRSHRYFPRLPQKPRWNGELKAWVFPDPTSKHGAQGAMVQFGFCERLEHVERYQGGEWGFIGFDELGNCPEERIWEDLLKEIRCPNPMVVRMARGTGNPGYAGHAWCKRRFVTSTDKGKKIHRFELKLPDGTELRLERRFFPAKVTDNPVYAKDPHYLAVLHSLPETRRKQLLEGDWDVGLGLALEELGEEHMVPAFEPPSHWTRFGGFDWGYNHKWVAFEACADEDGHVWLVDTVRGWRDLPHEISESISRRLNIHLMRYMSAGHDTWHERKARGENAPSVAETMIKSGIPLVKANQDRIHGLNNLRDYLSYKGRAPGGADIDPFLRIMETEGNRWLFEQCRDMVVDPDDVERPLKVDANPDTGEGGDDGFDALRYGMASRPQVAPQIAKAYVRDAWHPEILAYERDQMMRVRNRIPDRNPVDPMVASEM